MIKPIRLWLIPSGPTPYKVTIVLEELKIPYEITFFGFGEVKKKPFIDINPNGRVPAIEDPNTNLTLWESSAIIQYLVEPYDTEKVLTFDSLVMERYTNEVRRFLRLLDSCLDGKQWLVGNKCTLADLAFAPWNSMVGTLLSVSAEQKFDEFPSVKRWNERMPSRPSWKKAMDTWAKLMDEQGLQWNGMSKGISSIETYEEKREKDELVKAQY
ncbi:glutathione S-transferase II [Mytilinidion resinicola]|uniref:glutathione transferase n=1 Tax=Mytilinidion resinicola TaxID=574789 RepID=A0A6A6YLL8_9PEZI|nr:glutathione S-transferase II [Mytilinidion resinicola]KAF2808875.1 glutathione S-transferase II [Mytilinidion resinicola]